MIKIMQNLIKNNERLDDLQCNDLFIIQNPDKYCFTSDAVALANFAKVKSGGRLVDLCSGSGVIGILMSAKNNVSQVHLVEIQEYLADMSSRSVQYNKLDGFFIHNRALQNVHLDIGSGFDTVVCNPPYKKENTTKDVNPDLDIAIARHEIKVTLEDIILEASKLLKFGGEFYIVNKEERLIDMVCYLRKYNLEPKEIKILVGGKSANRVMIKAKKGGKSSVKITF
ncbi:MAG: methyltransferase [Clostridia bacterium]|nr:methyltransferase [Clostridia bacterium]